jgi:hypothetical protein
LGLP